MDIREIKTVKAPKAIGPYSQAILAPPFLFISGMVGIDPKVGKIVHPTIEGQTRQVLQNIEEVLKEATLSFKDVVKMEVFLKNLDDFQSMNQIYTEVFSQEIKPARHAFEVSRLPLGALIEISCTAYIQ